MVNLNSSSSTPSVNNNYNQNQNQNQNLNHDTKNSNSPVNKSPRVLVSNLSCSNLPSYSTSSEEEPNSSSTTSTLSSSPQKAEKLTWKQKMNPVKNVMQKVASDVVKDIGSGVAKAGAELSSSTQEIRRKLDKSKNSLTSSGTLRNSKSLSTELENKLTPPGVPEDSLAGGGGGPTRSQHVAMSSDVSSKFSTNPGTRSSLPQLSGSKAVDDCSVEYRYALWDSVADDADEISFSKGDRIRVISKSGDGWWIGELDNGTRGSFPSNYTATQSVFKSKVQDQSQQSKTMRPMRGGRGGPVRGGRGGNLANSSPNSNGPAVREDVNKRGRGKRVNSVRMPQTPKNLSQSNDGTKKFGTMRELPPINANANPKPKQFNTARALPQPK